MLYIRSGNMTMNTETPFANNVVIDIPRSLVVVDPFFGNIRGGVDTSLVDSIKQHSILEPLVVRPSSSGRGFYIVCGGRRYAAAVALGLETIPCIIKDIPDHQVNTYQLLDITRSDLPAVVIRNGEIVGGQMVGVCREVRGYELPNGDMAPPKDNALVALETGLTADVVGAFVALCDEPLWLLDRVANGDLAITVYSRMKSKPEDFKAKVLEKPGHISMAYVRDCIAKWNNGDVVEAQDGDVVEAQDGDVEVSELPRTVADFNDGFQDGERSASPLLQKALGMLRQIINGGYVVETHDLHTLEEIADIVDDLSR